MAEPLMVPSRETAREIKSLLDRARHTTVSRGVRSPYQRQLPQTPEVYPCRAPETGIAAINEGDTGTGTGGLGDDEPPSGECQVYGVYDVGGVPTMLPVEGLTLSVYNLSTAPIPPFAWLFAVRDKQGIWFAVRPGMGDGGGTGTTIGVEEVDGTPSYVDITTLIVDQADGFVFSQPAAGVARLDIAPASGTQAGVVSTAGQTFEGTKTFLQSVSVRDTTVTSQASVNLFALHSTFGYLTAASVTGAMTGGGTTTARLGNASVFGGSTGNAIEVTDAGLNLTSGVYKVGGSSGVSGSFTTTDSKTVTVTGGIITNIV